jgi:hypothetical protein
MANLAPSRRVSSPSWEALAIVLSSSTFAPICMIETIETTIQRWLRPMSATASPTCTPRALSAAVVWLISSRSSAHVISPASSMIAVWFGKRAAAAATADGKPGPQVASLMPALRSRWGGWTLRRPICRRTLSL